MKIILADAIKAINNSAEFTYTDEDINSINWINGTQPIDKNIILEKQAELQIVEDNKEIIKKQVEEKIQELKDEEVTREQGKQSALTKLSALGLTEAEIKAIIG